MSDCRVPMPVYAHPLEMDRPYMEEGELRCSECGHVTQAVAKYHRRGPGSFDAMVESEHAPFYCGHCGAKFNPVQREGYLEEKGWKA